MAIKKEAKNAVTTSEKNNITLLDTVSTLKLLRKYNIKTCKTEVCKDIKEFDSKHKKVGFPCVVKLASMETLHKTDAGAVIVGINSRKELAKAKSKIKNIITEKNIKSGTYEIIIQEMLSGIELFAGMKRNESFGPVILFGNGGIYVELYKDVSLRVAPLNLKDIKEMMTEMKAKALLDGFRGGIKVDKKKLSDTLMNLSKLSIKEKNIMEIDFNPIIATAKGVFVVDFRMLVRNE